jgi:hypothetical protein
MRIAGNGSISMGGSLTINSNDMILAAANQTSSSFGSSTWRSLIWFNESGNEHAKITVERPSWGYKPSEMVFYTSNSTDNNMNEALRITKDQNATFSGTITAKGGTFMDTAHTVLDVKGNPGWTNAYAMLRLTGEGNQNTYIRHTKQLTFDTGSATTATLTTGGNFTVYGTLSESSSIAIKENIFDFNTTLDKISRVRPVRFNKKKSKDKKEIGFIAEELAEIFPELVENDENGNPTSVNYTRAVTVLFDGFKQMYKELKEIKEKIK